MTKEEFKKWEKICKDAWEELAQSGSLDKPSSMDVFKNSCPACEIALRVTHIRGEDGMWDFPNCRHCPIDLWRKKWKNFVDPLDLICDMPGQLFHNWWKGAGLRDVKARKKIAKEISRLKWSYLPIFSYISVEFPSEK